MPSDNGEPTKSKKPADSAFKQQRLPAWQPILTAGTVLPTFFVIGIAFIPIGVGLLYFSDEVKEHVIDYTHCNQSTFDGKTFHMTDITCAEVIKNNNLANCTCVINFSLESTYEGKVFMYYGLSNFYQNHRRYVKSRDDNQLLGRLDAEPSSDCAPFAKAYDEEAKKDKPIAPCGAIANSLFSDRLSLKMINYTIIDVPLLRTGIAWDSDKNIKFRNPPGNLEKAFADFAKPKAWRQHVYELDPNNTSNNGFQNEDLIVWMRTAAFPTFRKLYRRIDHSQSEFKDGLPKGDYELHVDYWFL